MEYFSLNWARPPPTFSDEKNAIADALETDALSARTLEARADKCDAQRDGPAVKKCYDQAAQRALDEGEAFERVADAWLMHFHDTSTGAVKQKATRPSPRRSCPGRLLLRRTLQAA